MSDFRSFREPKPILGARALLFERLVDDQHESQEEARPLRIHDIVALRESVKREVARLLNTRRPHPETPQDRDELTVLDYGIPDFSHLNASSSVDRQNLAAILVRAISTFEPRLAEVGVTLEPSPGRPARLVGWIHAVLEVSSVKEPVSFPLTIGIEAGDATMLESY